MVTGTESAGNETRGAHFQKTETPEKNAEYERAKRNCPDVVGAVMYPVTAVSTAPTKGTDRLDSIIGQASCSIRLWLTLVSAEVTKHAYGWGVRIVGHGSLNCNAKAVPGGVQEKPQLG